MLRPVGPPGELTVRPLEDLQRLQRTVQLEVAVVKREFPQNAVLPKKEVSRLNKELVAYATSVANDGKLSMLYRAEVLRGLGLTNEQLFEVTTVVSIFVKNASFTTALQLEPAPA